MTESARSSLIWPLAGVLLAIGITSTMDATGYTMFSALPLLPLMALFWFLQRLTRAETSLVGLSLNYISAIGLSMWWIQRSEQE